MAWPKGMSRKEYNANKNKPAKKKPGRPKGSTKTATGSPSLTDNQDLYQVVLWCSASDLKELAHKYSPLTIRAYEI